jgi:hypothetical protein
MARSWRVHGARVEKSAPQRSGRSTIGFARRLRIDGQREPRIGVAEAGLGGLQIDAVEHQRGGVGPAQVVKRESRETCSASGRKPNPASPTLVAQRSALLAHEDEGVGIGALEATTSEMIREHRGERGRHGERPPTGLRLRRPRDMSTTLPARDLLRDDERRPQEVDAPDAQSPTNLNADRYSQRGS